MLLAHDVVVVVDPLQQAEPVFLVEVDRPFVVRHHMQSHQLYLRLRCGEGEELIEQSPRQSLAPHLVNDSKGHYVNRVLTEAEHAVDPAIHHVIRLRRYLKHYRSDYHSHWFFFWVWGQQHICDVAMRESFHDLHVKLVAVVQGKPLSLQQLQLLEVSELMPADRWLRKRGMFEVLGELFVDFAGCYRSFAGRKGLGDELHPTEGLLSIITNIAKSAKSFNSYHFLMKIADDIER